MGKVNLNAWTIIDDEEKFLDVVNARIAQYPDGSLINSINKDLLKEWEGIKEENLNQNI
jgi:hypothetical protein